MKKLAEIAQLFDSLHKTPNYVDQGFPMVRVTNIKRGFMDLSGTMQVDEPTYEEFTKRYKPQEGDILFSRVGSYGNSCYVNRTAQFCLGQNTVCISPNKERIDPYFLYCCLNSDLIRNQIEGVVGGASQPTVSLANINKLSIPCPDLTNQKRISSIISAYDDLIENNTRRINLLEETAQMIYREWFVNFRFPGHEKIKMVESEMGMVPAKWRVGVLEDALVLQRGFDLPKSQRQSGSVPIYAATGINGYHNLAKVKGPGVITGRSGSLGNVMLILDENFWPLNTTLWVKKFRQSNAAHSFFLLSDLKLTGFNSGAAVPTLNRNDIHGLPCLLPDSETLDAFNECVLPMFQLWRILEQKTGLLQKTRDFLLPKLISGEISVEHLETKTVNQIS